MANANTSIHMQVKGKYTQMHTHTHKRFAKACKEHISTHAHTYRAAALIEQSGVMTVVPVLAVLGVVPDLLLRANIVEMK